MKHNHLWCTVCALFIILDETEYEGSAYCFLYRQEVCTAGHMDTDLFSFVIKAIHPCMFGFSFTEQTY
jgi:hypothetical protein